MRHRAHNYLSIPRIAQGLLALAITIAPSVSKADTPALSSNSTPSFVSRVSLRQLQPALCQVGPIIEGHFVPLYLRLGAELSPRTKFDGGVDLDVPGLHFGSASARIDFDAIVSANFGGVSTLFPLTFDVITHPGFVGIHNPYAGFGIGPYFGERTRFGGKIVVGANISRGFGLEGAVHFAGYGPALFTLQARFPL